nr:hypothetical protein [uncultured Mitsuokella sp.]
MGLGQHIVRVDVHFAAVHGGFGQRGLLLAVVDLALGACRGVHSHRAVGSHIDLPETALVIPDIGIAVLAGQDHIIMLFRLAADIHLFDTSRRAICPEIGQIAMDIHLLRGCLFFLGFIVWVVLIGIDIGHGTILIEFGTGDGIRAPGRGFCIGGNSGIAPGRRILRQGARTVAESRGARGRCAGIVAEGDRVIVLGNGLLAKGQGTSAKRFCSVAKSYSILTAIFLCLGIYFSVARLGAITKGNRAFRKSLCPFTKSH